MQILRAGAMITLVACGAAQPAATIDDWVLEFEGATAHACDCESAECYDESQRVAAELVRAEPEFADSARGRALQAEFAACTPPASDAARSLAHARDIICSCRDEDCVLAFRRATLELHDEHDIRFDEEPPVDLSAQEEELWRATKECHSNVSIDAEELASHFHSVAAELCACTSLDCAQGALAAHRERTSSALIITELEAHEGALGSARNRFCECASEAIGRGVEIELGALFRNIGFNLQASGTFALECR